MAQFQHQNQMNNQAYLNSQASCLIGETVFGQYLGQVLPQGYQNFA